MRDDADKHLGDDPSADFAQAVPTALNRRFPQDVQPERRLAVPSWNPKFARSQGFYAQRSRHTLA